MSAVSPNHSSTEISTDMSPSVMEFVRCTQSEQVPSRYAVCRDRSCQAAGFSLPIEVRGLPGPQVRGTGGTLISDWRECRDQGHPRARHRPSSSDHDLIASPAHRKERDEPGTALTALRDSHERATCPFQGRVVKRPLLHPGYFELIGSGGKCVAGLAVL